MKQLNCLHTRGRYLCEYLLINADDCWSVTPAKMTAKECTRCLAIRVSKRCHVMPTASGRNAIINHIENYHLRLFD